MSVLIFDGENSSDDAAFEDWRSNNEENGYIINTNRIGDPSFLEVHIASCGKIKPDNLHGGTRSFTSGKTRKVVSNNMTDLIKWSESNNVKCVEMKHCHCCP